MPRIGAGLLVTLGLLPFIVGAAPDASPTTVVPPACTGLPSPTQLIPGLTTGEVVVSGGTATLRFASGAFACGHWPDSMEATCEDQWRFTLSMPASDIQPGTYDLSTPSTQFGELFDSAGPPQEQSGCSQEKCTTHQYGVGSVALSPDAGAGAILEIYSAGSECVTGKITGLTDPVFPDAPDHNGLFFAVRCAN